MQFFVGVDVSLDSASICVIDERGVIIEPCTANSRPQPARAATRPAKTATILTSRPAASTCARDPEPAMTSPNISAASLRQTCRSGIAASVSRRASRNIAEPRY